MLSSYNVESRNINSFEGFVSAEDLVEAISPHIATIFDENIRLYEYGSKVNEGINRTATSTDQADMFFFYNNGVVFICDKGANSLASNRIVIEGASVVNGCQTLNVLYNAKQKGKLRAEVCLPVRIIEIADYGERMKITEYLNSQTQIKASYFVANHPIVRDLQESLLEKGYFLESVVKHYCTYFNCFRFAYYSYFFFIDSIHFQIDDYVFHKTPPLSCVVLFVVGKSACFLFVSIIITQRKLDVKIKC